MIDKNSHPELYIRQVMKQKRPILLVDDNEDDLFLLKMAFEKAEFHSPLQEVHNGEEAVAYLNGDGAYADRDKFPMPVVMLLDLNMPMKNGFDVLAWLSAQPGLKRLTVVIFTASMREQDVERAYDLGANAFLVKPSTIEELTALIRCLRDWLQYNHFPPLNDPVKK